MSEIEFGPEDMLAGYMGEMVDNAVAEHGNKPAFSCILPTGHYETLTYTEIGRYSDAVAAYLREDLGLKPGDVVAIQAPNTLAYPILAFGILKAGLIVTNINPLYTAEETNHQLKDSCAKVWFVIDVFGNRVAQSTEGTSVERVYKLSLVDMFSGLKRHLLAFALKYLKKAVPPFEGTVAGTLASVIGAGEKHLGRVDIKSYRAHASLDDVAIYQYTGGTTGRSKGAELTHRNVVANISQANKRGDAIDNQPDDAMLLILPLYHVYALAVGALNSMYKGTHVVLVPVPRPLSNLKVAFETFNITIMPGVNTLYLGLMQEPWFVANPPKNLRLCFSGAAPLQPATADKWEKLTGCAIYEGYGLTEGTCVVSTMPLDQPPKRGTCGKPIPGTEVRIVGENGEDLPRGEAGELWLKGPQIMKGYLHNPEATGATIKDGWLKTGDVAVYDAEGYLSIVDRIKDMVIVSGFNVYPTDIESVLTHSERIAEAAVVGVPDDETGERVVAYVVPKDEDLTEGEVIAYCKQHLTGYKVPKTVVLVKELPKSPVGKVLRRELRDQAAGAAKPV
ncbi:long-chain-fatty-acid--CoA ligase [Kordiimonas marina]|uniref:long-chain-fatty-acid--CoA ligase n=1 Tax=Kordiimonas marina TaxID=2872312 RepID=UPI001FF1DBFB|nr:long-chain fatty acid--CoA ligase [Kordiimonas marina]MCJ9429078.1 long-chain fatty acid--CoA ligase [Kordiimonas marina]